MKTIQVDDNWTVEVNWPKVHHYNYNRREAVGLLQQAIRAIIDGDKLPESNNCDAYQLIADTFRVFSNK